MFENINYGVIMSEFESIENQDTKNLVRGLDILLNGEQGAAKQASLCDIVSQVKREGIKRGFAPNLAVQELADALIELVYSYADKCTVGEAIGAIEVVKLEIFADQVANK